MTPELASNLSLEYMEERGRRAASHRLLESQITDSVSACPVVPLWPAQNVTAMSVSASCALKTHWPRAAQPRIKDRAGIDRHFGDEHRPGLRRAKDGVVCKVTVGLVMDAPGYTSDAASHTTSFQFNRSAANDPSNPEKSRTSTPRLPDCCHRHHPECRRLLGSRWR